jgi:hypothetical protein
MAGLLAHQGRGPIRSRRQGKRGAGPALLLAAACLSWGAGARAAEPKAPEESWYGYQTLGADTLAITLLIGSSQSYGGLDTALLVGATGAYLAGAPSIHLLNAQSSSALISLGVRVGAPLVGATMGWAASKFMPYDDGDEEVRGLAIGVLLGLLAPMVVDAAALAWKPTAAAKSIAGTPALTWRPSVAVTSEHFEFGVAGGF